MALLSQGTTSRHKHIFFFFFKGDCGRTPLNRTRKLQALCSVFFSAVFTASQQSEEESSVRWTSSRSFANISAEKPSTGPSNDIFSQQKRTWQKSAASHHLCVLFLLTHRAHIPQKKTKNKQHAALHPSVPQHASPQNVSCREVAIPEESVDKDRTTLTVHIQNFEKHIAAMNTYTSHQMHIKSIQLSVTYYIQAPRKRCDDKVNSRFLPFAQVWSQIPSNTQQLVVHKIRIQN